MTQTVSNGSQHPPSQSQFDEELLQEFFNSAGEKLWNDPDSGVLRGVKLLGLRSRNGRRYLESALSKAIGLYEGSKVNVNHPDRGPLAPRDYRDRIGVIRNVALRTGEGLFGDLHYNPRHALAEQLAWDAQHAPENLGLSHNVLAKTRHEAGGVVVEAIARVQSVDLVADPATTSGLFEQLDNEPPKKISETEAAELDRLRAEVPALREQVARLSRRALIDRKLISEGVLPADAQELVTEGFARQLRDAASDEDALGLLEDRLCMWRRSESQRPISQAREALTAERATLDTAEFVAAVAGRPAYSDR